jgi:hypothetical protein
MMMVMVMMGVMNWICVMSIEQGQRPTVDLL